MSSLYDTIAPLVTALDSKFNYVRGAIFGSGTATWIKKAGVPDSSDGVDGNYCINTLTNVAYKRTSGTWTIVSASGGSGLHTSISNPISSDGIDGDFWINTSNSTIFGPKASGTWPTGVSLIGANLSSIQGLTSVADSFPYFTGSGTSALQTINSTIRTLLGSATLQAFANSLPTFTASGASHAKGLVPDTPSTSGTTKFLREDATWSAPPSGSVTILNTSTPGGRLTPVSNDPYGEASGVTSIYYTPATHDQLPLWDGTTYLPITFTNTAISLGTLTASQGYDVFSYLNSGSASFELLEWANSAVTMTIASPGVVTWTGHTLVAGDSLTLTTTGALPTGLTAGTIYYVVNPATNTFQLSANKGGTAINTSGTQSGTHTAHCNTQRAVSLVRNQGRLSKSTDLTRLFLGSFFTSTATTTENTSVNAYISNLYNQVRKTVSKSDITNHTYGTNSWRAFNNNASLTQVNLFTCITQSVDLRLAGALGTVAGGANWAIMSIFLDNAIAPNSLRSWGAGGVSSLYASAHCEGESSLLGFHQVYAAENGQGSANSYFFEAQTKVSFMY